jgi:hypothetical protein
MEMLKYIFFLVLIYTEVGGGGWPFFQLGPLYGVPFKGKGLWTLFTPFTLVGNCKVINKNIFMIK